MATADPMEVLVVLSIDVGPIAAAAINAVVGRRERGAHNSDAKCLR